VANLLSTPSKEEADSAWKRLEAQGGSNLLYRYETQVDGTNQHRLRLGFFQDRASAEAAATDLSRKAGLGAPWLVQPNLSEVRKYNLPQLSNLWSVNISSTPDKAESDAIWEALNQGQAKETFASLEAQRDQSLAGLSLYRYEAQVDSVNQYRIRLGFFDTGAKAEAAGRELAQAASLSQSRIGLPWAVRPNQAEVDSHKK
jgi:hypothetical protein